MFMMVTAVRYELVQLSEVQDKIAELSRIAQQVCIVNTGSWQKICSSYVLFCASKYMN